MRAPLHTRLPGTVAAFLLGLGLMAVLPFVMAWAVWNGDSDDQNA